MTDLTGILTEDQIALRQMTHDFMEKEVVPYCTAWDRDAIFPMETYKKSCELGLNALELPVEYGGVGLSYLDLAIVMEEVCWGDAGFGATLGAHGLGMKPLVLAGTEAQRKHFAEVVVDGKGLSAFALTEPNAGSDVAATATTARKVGSDYVINGRKCFCTNAEYADIFTIFATVDKSLGAKGLTAFTVDRNTPGLSIGKHEDKLGQRSSVTNDVVFEEMVIPESQRIGAEGKGFGIAMQTLDRGRAGAASSAAGVGRAALEHCVKYAKERKTMGKPIIDHQAIQIMLADMATGIEASRQIGWYVARLLDAGKIKEASKVGAMSKCFATDTLMKICTDAVQIMGGYGYSREYPVEKLFRDAKIFQIFEGTNQIQRTVIANHLKHEI